jgi:hypothetical protein
VAGVSEVQPIKRLMIANMTITKRDFLLTFPPLEFAC